MSNSTSQAVGDAAKAAVDALALVAPGAAAPVRSVKRKTPGQPEGSARTLPVVVVSVGAEGRTQLLSATQKLKTYPVAVTIVTNTGEQLADDPTVRQWRQQIELALEATATWISAVPGWNLTTITTKAPFDASALAKDFVYATVVADVEVIEARST